jgi:hypothetical protein
LRAAVFFPCPFPLDLILGFFSLGFFAAVVETLLLSAGEGLLLLWEVIAVLFDFCFWLVGFDFFVWAVAVPFGFIAFFLPPPNSVCCQTRYQF